MAAGELDHVPGVKALSLRQRRALQRQRQLRRRSREKNAIPIVSLVGYTNTGKSTLLNRITDAGVYAENKLFATLDAVSRRVELPDGGEFLLVDTVGFISKLPHDLVEAFKSTLEEAALSDLLVIVSDASSPDAQEQRQGQPERQERARPPAQAPLPADRAGEQDPPPGAGGQGQE